MTKYLIDETSLTNIGDAIRTKKGTTSVIPVTDMPDEILSISGGGTVDPISISTYTTLYSGDYSEGKPSYTLSQSWRNFDGIKITWSADIDFAKYHSYGYFDKEVLEMAVEDNKPIILQKPTKSWYGTYFLDDTTLTRQTGNYDGIIKIEGFNYNRSIVDFDLLAESVYGNISYNLPSNWNEYERLVCVLWAPTPYVYQFEIPIIKNVKEFTIPIFTEHQSSFACLDFDGDTITLGGSTTTTRIYGVNHANE